MVPIVSVVGRSNAGKTTFLEKLIGELTRRGRRVGTVKHDAHRFEIDKPGKDSWRHAQAGSKAVAIASAEKLAVIRQVDGETSLDALAMLFEPDVDIVLTEGYKAGDKPKIEISRREQSSQLVSRPEELIAIVTDQRYPLDIPHYGLDDAAGVADLLEERFLRQAVRDTVALLVDGRRIALEPFASYVLDRTCRAILSLLEGCEQAREVTLVLRPKTANKTE